MTDNASPADLVRLLDDLDQPRLLVLGDLILDQYTWGSAERISQEAPVVVLREDERDSRPGGAANVAAMLRGLDADVVCAGFVGPDAEGRQLGALLASAGADTSLVWEDAQRPTTVKHRFVGRANDRHANQILRVDRESRTPLSDALVSRFIPAVCDALRTVDAVLISDYGKGVCTDRLLRALIDAARGARLPILVDPAANGHFERYRGATLLKPNRVETQAASGIRIRTPDDACRAGAEFCRQFDIELAVVTLDRDGMALAGPHVEPRVYPTSPRAVYDITGAGDLVLAVLGLCLACRLPADAAIRLGNAAAGLEVERSGVAIVTRGELRAELVAALPVPPPKVVSLGEAAARAARARGMGRRVVFTNGCFDLLHVGHISYLAEAAAMGDVLVVGVNSDSSVRRLKGPARPIIGERDRAAMLAALECVDCVLIFDDATPHRLLETLRPDVLVKGGTYQPSEVVGREVVESYGGEVRIAQMVGGISTTDILESLRQGRTHAALRAAG